MTAVTIERPQKVRTPARERVRKQVSVTLQVSRQVFAGLCQKNVMITLALVALLVASAVGVVATTHLNRDLFNTLSGLHAERDDYQREWSQLLLEQSALSAHSRIERRASDELNMIVPGEQHIVLVPSAMPFAVAQ